MAIYDQWIPLTTINVEDGIDTSHGISTSRINISHPFQKCKKPKKLENFHSWSFYRIDTDIMGEINHKP